MKTPGNRRLITSAALLSLVIMTLICLTACTEGGTDEHQARLTVTFTPDPVLRSGDGKWYYKVYIQEEEGIGVTIYGYSVASYSPNDNYLHEEFHNAQDFSDLFGCDSLENYIPGGLNACSETVTNEGTTGYRVWSFKGKDDRGNLITASGKINLN